MEVERIFQLRQISHDTGSLHISVPVFEIDIGIILPHLYYAGGCVKICILGVCQLWYIMEVICLVISGKFYDKCSAMTTVDMKFSSMFNDNNLLLARVIAGNL